MRVVSGWRRCAGCHRPGEVGPFPRFGPNREAMLRVVRNHRRAAYNVPKGEYEGLSIIPVGLDEAYCPHYLVEAARKAPGKFNIGAINPGSTQNLSTHLFKQITGADFTIIPYRAAPDLVIAVLQRRACVE